VEALKSKRLAYSGWRRRCRVGLGRGGVREIFDYLIIKWRIFDLWYSEVLIFLSAALQRKAEYTYKYRPKTRTKGGTYMKEPNQSTLQLQQFRLQNEVESSGFLSKCAEHVVLRRTLLKVKVAL